MDEENCHYYNILGFHRKFKSNNEQCPPKDVTDAFTSCTNNDPHMSPDHFQRFLIEYQGEEYVSVDDVKSIMEQLLVRSRPNFTVCSFKLEDFLKYLFDELNGPIPTKVHHDMTAPLNHYFIYTSHNSYLTGDQLLSDSSEVPIIKALHKGVRVIELDLWPNKAEDRIHVRHGRTLTTPVTLSTCLKSIKEHAFVTSPYPVIITLEDHLTPSLRDKVTEMTTKIFGDMLYCPKTGDKHEFPSPEELKLHIIISTKPPTTCLETKLEEESCIGEETLYGCKDGNLTDETDEDLSKLDQNVLQDFEDEDEDEDGESEKPGQRTPIEYRQIIGIHAAKPTKGLRHALKVGSWKGKRLSLCEQDLERVAGLYGTDLVRFTQKNLVRVYPAGRRITSTNFQPMLAWTHGAQMVASNMQGHGRYLWMMYGMFRSNGGCGYVKKPDFLMNEVFDPNVTLHVKKTLKVTVYMGDGWRMDFKQRHFDTFSPPDFYAKMYMVGVPADVTEKKTKVIHDDWIPVWNEEFTFPLTVPELALLKIVVNDYDLTDKDDFGGQTCLPVSQLRSGIRSVPLHDEKGEKLPSVKLLMRFAFE